MGLAFALMELVSDSLRATLAGRARRWLARAPQRLDAAGATGGVLMVGLAAALVATE